MESNITSVREPAKRKRGAKLFACLKREMDLASPVPRYYQLQEAIRQQIKAGVLRPNDQLPSSQVLADGLNITRVTVDKAINALVGENLLERIRGIGTFVRRPPQAIPVQHIASLLLPSHDHLWSGVVPAVVQGLTHHEIFCMVTEFALQKDEPVSSALRSKIRRVIESQPAHLVIRGVSRFPVEMLEHYENQLIFVELCEHVDPPPANHILTDRAAGGRIVAEHLRGLGHRKMIVWTPPAEPRHQARHAYLAGIRAGAGDDCQVLHATDLAQVRTLLADPKGPRAIATQEDSMMIDVYEIAKQLGLRIGTDLAAVGYYDTPWCQTLEPKLTSVSIHCDRLGEAVVRAILENSRDTRIVIPPTLIIRDSCGG